MYRGQHQTMRQAFSDICQGERPWTALGNFMNEWYAYAKDRREALVADPLPAYDEHSLDQRRWAVFCAAAVEWFCARYQVPCPSWVHDPHYTLTEPWFFHTKEKVKARLRTTTPDEFQRRNIFCGDRCFLNKWEWAENLQLQL